MGYVILGFFVLLLTALGIGWLYILYDTLRDTICPKHPFQRHWKWRMSALLVFVVSFTGGIFVILLITSAVQGVTQ